MWGAVLWVLAGEADVARASGVNLIDAAVYYGIASPFLGYLLWVNRQQAKAIADKDAKIEAQNAEALARVTEFIPLLRDSTSALARTADVLDRRRSRDA